MILTTGEITFKKGSIKIFINNNEKIHTSKPSLKAMLSFQEKEKQLVSSVSQSCLFATPWTVAHQASLCITNFQSLLKHISIELVMPSNHLILCHLHLLLPSVFPSIRIFSSESVLHIRWPKYWSFSFNISPSNEYSGLTSFRMD